MASDHQPRWYRKSLVIVVEVAALDDPCEHQSGRQPCSNVLKGLDNQRFTNYFVGDAGGPSDELAGVTTVAADMGLLATSNPF